HPLARRPDGSFRSLLLAHDLSTLTDHALLHDLNDAARTRLDQHGLAVHHGVAVGRGAEGLRHVIIGHAIFRQHAADDHAIRNRVAGNVLTHDIFAERRTLVDRDADVVVADDHTFAADDPDGLRLRRERHTQ